MTLNPFQRFLGVDSVKDPFTLLGLSPERCEPVHVDMALREQLAKVYRHPDGGSSEAEAVRQALRKAAEQIKQARGAGAIGTLSPASPPPMIESQLPDLQSYLSSSRETPSSSFLQNLTTFDKLVLAALVAHGGWNAASRARLVALASAYGVSVQGLLRVVQGLCQSAAKGGPRFDGRQIAAVNQALAYRPPVSSAAAVGPPLLDRLAEPLAEELRRDSLMTTIKLSGLFAVLTLVAIIFGARLMFSSSPQAEDHMQPTQPTAPPQHNALSPDAARSAREDMQAERQTRLATYPSPPTFQGNALPIEAVDAADGVAALEGYLEDVIRRLSIAEDPSEAVYQNWSVSIDTMAKGWVLVDASTIQTVEYQVYESLRLASASPTVSDRMLHAMLPPAKINQPLDIWRGAWLAGMLGQISGSSTMPPVVVERARAQLQVSLEPASQVELNFNAAARAWLQKAAHQLVKELEFNKAIYDSWELWLASQRKIGGVAAHDLALMDAVAAILMTENDLGRPGPSVNVLGRLVSIVVERPAAAVQRRILDLFDDPRCSNRDLWVLTSLLASSDKAFWYPRTLVLPEDADQRHRWRVRDDVANVWPAESRSTTRLAQGRSFVIDEVAANRWKATLKMVLDVPLDRSADGLMGQLVQVSRLNEAAHLLAMQNPSQVYGILDEITSELDGTAPAPIDAAPTRSRMGQAIGIDGEWAQRYQQIGRSNDQRLEVLRLLRNSAGTDLGRTDAEVFVRELYRSSSPEVRALAQAIAVEQFAEGPNVAMELVDQFPTALVSEQLSTMIQDLTQRVLPPARSEQWRHEARLALVLHVLRLRADGESLVDALCPPLAESYARRAAFVMRETYGGPLPRTPQEAGEALWQAWNNQAAAVMTSRPVPADLASLQRQQTTRLQLAEGLVQQFVAYQLGVLDLLTYITVAEQPPLRDDAVALLRKATAARHRLTTVLEQAVEIERTIAQVWAMRLGVDSDNTAAEGMFDVNMKVNEERLR